MTPDTLKIVIPMAGWGTRMRPHTWSKPKPLVSVAGKTALDHLLGMFHTLPDPQSSEYVFIVGPYLGEQQIPPFVAQNYPHIKAHYVLQAEMKGQSHALWLAREHLTGPLLMVYSDTLIETDFAFLAGEPLDGVTWVKPVPDPRRFGVAEIDASGGVTRLIEKPQSLENNLALVGCYYFKSGEALSAAIEEQLRRGIQLKGEYFLADAVNIMLERGTEFRTQRVAVWLDTGTIEATLETNRYLLERGCANKTKNEKRKNVKVVPPVYVDPTAEVSDSVIGPYASIGPNCKIARSRIENSILEAGVQVNAAALSGSIIGRQARVEGRGVEGPPATLNIGDDSSVICL